MKDKKWLKDMRIKHNLTQEKLAINTGLSKYTIENIEQGKRKGDKKTWDAIEKYFANTSKKRSPKSLFLKAIEKQHYYENFITRSIKSSNAIEGNTLSYAETYSIVFADESLPLQNINPRELYEAINLKYALNYSLEHLNSFNTSLVIKINELINKNIKDTKGYRTGKVLIKGADFVPPQASLVPSMLNELIYQYQNSEAPLLERIAFFHIGFERIHPFEDGNGRTGRVLINHMLINENQVPLVIPEEKRIEYFEYLQNEDTIGLAKMFADLQEKEKAKIKEYTK
ncbi:MAG: Fic family protein [Bacilli bacterium]|nr:Fic family protein [Bacilli bacterium]